MEFHDQSLQFMNKHYFQTKSDYENNTIFKTLLLLSLIPGALFFFFSNIILYKIDWIYFYLMYFSDNTYSKVIANLPSVLVISVAVNLTLLSVHVLAIKEGYSYEKEIFHFLGVFAIQIFFFFAGIPLISFISIASTAHYHKKNKTDKLHSLVVASIIVNMMYLGCIFSPYMLLAFINDPLQTTFFYLVIVALIACAYLSVLPFTKCCSSGFTKAGLAQAGFIKTLKLGYFALSLAVSAVFIIVVLLFIVTLGSFNDFEEINNLLLPLLVGMFGILIIQPYKQQVKMHSQSTSTSGEDDSSTAQSTQGTELTMLTFQYNNFVQN